jgi:hypothetical protein
MRKTFLPRQSSHSRTRQVKHAQNEFNSDKYTLTAVRVRSGMLFDVVCDPNALHQAYNECLTYLHRTLTSPLFLPIRDRDKYNTHNKILSHGSVCAKRHAS